MDKNLQRLGSKLLVLRGNPNEIFEILFKSGKFSNLFYEKDTEPYSIARDKAVDDLCKEHNISSQSFWGHTLYPPEEILKLNNGVCVTKEKKLASILSKISEVPDCVRNPETDEIMDFDIYLLLEEINYQKASGIPKLDELLDENGNSIQDKPTHILKGGETEGLRILSDYLKEKSKIVTFQKQLTSPTEANPASTTMLSPYLKFGSVSIRKFHQELNTILKEAEKYTRPPNSLMGQIYWRELFYSNSYYTNNFHLMKNNEACKEIDWYLNTYPFEDKAENIPKEELEAEQHLKAWAEGRTGYPWIDAIMIQLRQEGWIHHYARHAVGCFLSKGDLYINWERGVEVFEELSLDADYALNAGNWMYLSSSSVFYYAYFRYYSPNTYGKKFDPNGDYIRKYIPKLEKFPKEFIFEPWKAPIKLQQELGCIIGVDYPERIVIHEVKKIFYKFLFF